MTIQKTGKVGNMKRLITICICCLSIFSCLVTTSSASLLGTAAQVISSDVSMIKSGLLGRRITFSDEDFKSALCISDFDKITIESLPKSSEGTLMLSGRRVREGAQIKRKNLALLEFVPKSREVTEAHFTFSCDGGAEIECTLKFLDKINYPPEHKNSEESAVMKTYEAVSLFGRLYAEDPEGDELEYIVVAYPSHGYIETEADGKYVYTPNDGYVGRDKFTYVVRDSYGNYTKPKSVTLAVYQRTSNVEYEDMVGAREHNAAIAMTALGVMNGKLVGDKTYFCPEENLTRAEFVAMLLKSQGIKPDSTASQTFFDDNSDIPKALIGYVAVAQRLGVIGGDFEDGKLVFKPNEGITKYECAKIISTLLGGNASGEEEVFMTDDGVPVWARGSVCHMKTLGIFDADEGGLANVATKADVAEYLYRLIG